MTDKTPLDKYEQKGYALEACPDAKALDAAVALTASPREECEAGGCRRTDESIMKREVGTTILALCHECADVRRSLRSNRAGSTPGSPP